jgi:hypothetical protein
MAGGGRVDSAPADDHLPDIPFRDLTPAKAQGRITLRQRILSFLARRPDATVGDISWGLGYRDRGRVIVVRQLMDMVLLGELRVRAVKSHDVR